MAIWNEIQEQLKELQQLLDERKQLDKIYNKIKADNGKLLVEPTKLLWALGHFSRWIRPGMKRYEVKRFNTQKSRQDGLMINTSLLTQT